jgi:hypothetical protein
MVSSKAMPARQHRDELRVRAEADAAAGQLLGIAFKHARMPTNATEKMRCQ